MTQTKLNFDNSAKNDKYYLGLSNILINRPFFKSKIFEFFDYDIKRVFQADKTDLESFSERYENVPVPRDFLSEIRALNLEKIYNEAQAARDAGINYVTFEDEIYPENLRKIEDFPLLLYYKGDFSNLNFERTISIVGSRNATEGAKQNVRKIVHGFLNTDVVVVSGLAAGIDTAAHSSAIENNLKTLAVIGSGLNQRYPYQNRMLYAQIEEKYGAVISEYPNAFSAMPQNFPQRNRIITGLSAGVLVAEARMKSGAMISAKLALEQGKELMCIPGLISNPNCEGIYHLIKNGANIVTKTEDILDILNWEISPQKQGVQELSGVEKQIYETVSSGEISFEGLKQKLNIGINELMVQLTAMEIKGLIIQKNGLYYMLGN